MIFYSLEKVSFRHKNIKRVLFASDKNPKLYFSTAGNSSIKFTIKMEPR